MVFLIVLIFTESAFQTTLGRFSQSLGAKKEKNLSGISGTCDGADNLVTYFVFRVDVVYSAGQY